MTPGTRVFADTSEERKIALAYAARLMQAQFDESDAIATTTGEFVALGELFATVAVDVIPGEAAVMTVSEGTPRKQATEGGKPELEPTPEV